MRVAIYDQDIQFAANLALTIKRSIAGSDVCYCESMDDSRLYTSTLVVADPHPKATREWLSLFRRNNPSGTLLLVSKNVDMLSGSFGDPCYAITKPYLWQDSKDSVKFIRDAMDIIRFVYTGHPVSTMNLGRKEN